jgi:hypothetical protein
MKNENGMPETRPFHLDREQFQAFLRYMNTEGGGSCETNPSAPHCLE